jgi:hypothetical protein
MFDEKVGDSVDDVDEEMRGVDRGKKILKARYFCLQATGL